MLTNDRYISDGLRKFLNDKELLEAYEGHVARIPSEGTPYKKHYVSYAFKWANTTEGHNFWSKIDTEWKEECNE